MSDSEENDWSASENTESVEDEETEDSFTETNEGNLKRKSSNDHPERKKINKLGKSDLYKPPTSEELNRLQETENLFNSNLFRLQIEELLNEIKVKQRHINDFENWYKEFQKIIENMPEYKFSNCNKQNVLKQKKAKLAFEKIEVNLCKTNIKSDHKGIDKFLKPVSVDTFGSYKINSIIGPNLEVTLKVTMPKSYFKEKDYLNNRYTIKYNYYLSYLATELEKSDLCSTISYFFDHSYMPLPVLTLSPKTNEQVIIKIYAVPEEGVFKMSRFEPIRNNVKLNIFQDAFVINEELLKNSPTPFYNAKIARNLMLDLNYKLLENTLKDLTNVQDGIKLLLVWLKQRSLSKSYFGFTEEILVFTILYLTIKRRINKHMSSYQVVRNFWYFISSTDWREKPISLCEDIKEEHLLQFKNYFDVVFVDKTGYYNFAAFLDVNVYLKVKEEAELAVSVLDRAQFNSFGALFMTKMPFEVQYDSVLTIHDEEEFLTASNTIDETVKHKYIGFYELLTQKNILKYLKLGLNKRIKNIVPYPTDDITQDLRSELKHDFKKITFGIILNPEYAFKVIEIGPSAEDKEKALEFQKFWGELAHCRRFNDGSICEAVYFEAGTLQEKRGIFKRIIDFVLSQKLNLKNYYLFCDELERFISPYGNSTNEEPTLKIITAFDELTKLLRSLALPLDIAAIHGKSDVFCYSDLFPPLPVICKPGKKVTTLVGNNNLIREDINVEWIPKYCAPIECVFHLSLHSKWPNNLEALRHIKIAFYLKISDLLIRLHNIKSNVRLEHLDVFFKGYVFRFSLYHPKEVGFLKKQQTSPDGFISYKDTEESLQYEKEFDILCKINGALNGIQSQFPSFGPSTTLIKRWLRSQLIDNCYIPDVVINMLNASIYLSSAPFQNANLPQVQFLRFLKFLHEWDWNLNPIVVNFNDELSKDQLDTFETNFHKNRQNYPTLYIIMPYDEGKSLFTIKTCSKEILRRIAILSAALYKILMENTVYSANSTVLMDTFIPNLEGYSVIIHLKPFLNSRRNQQINFMKKENYKDDEKFDKNKPVGIPVTGFNPVDIYVDELRRHYGELAFFFYNPYGGCRVCVLWKPSVMEEKEFKVSCVSARKLNNLNKLIFNEDAVIEDFYILGSGLVKTIGKR